VSLIGIRGGLSVDHLVAEDSGARFNCLGGPGLFAALGARLVTGTRVRLSCPHPLDEPRFGTLFADMGIDTGSCIDVPTVPRLWILNSREGRRLVSVSDTSGTEIDAGPDDEHVVDMPDPGQAFYDGLDGLLLSSPAHGPQVNVPVIGVDPHQSHVARHGMSYLAQLAASATVWLPSRVQLRLIDTDPRAAAHRILGELGIPVVARLDAEGCYVVTPAGSWTIRDKEVRVVETTGAGDASAAAVVAALSGGADPVEAAAIGTSIARVALADWGAAALQSAEPLASPLPGITITKEHTT
jgi:sugar/nucleoside kinase (ribokinase family)